MKKVENYKDLEVWQRSIELVKAIYSIAETFPDKERYGLVNQMRRSAVSIPSNIAEGKTRQHLNEYIQFLYVSLGSCAELETQIIISHQLGYINKDTESLLLEKVDHISRMLRNLVKGLRK